MSGEVVRIVSEALQLPTNVAVGDVVKVKAQLVNDDGDRLGEVALELTVTEVVVLPGAT